MLYASMPPEYCSMYIILRGTISVYIDASLSGEEPSDPFLSPIVSPSRDSPDRRPKQMERAHYGKFIIRYGESLRLIEKAIT